MLLEGWELVGPLLARLNGCRCPGCELTKFNRFVGGVGCDGV